MAKALMIYGASGYTGRLATGVALARGMQPILAGRSEAKIARFAEEHSLPYRVFTLDDPEDAAVSLEGVGAVLHCAGPFSSTARPMVDACLQARTHYLDITGEIAVFEDVLARGKEAERARVLLVPGVGFDVVPTDCLAAMLAGRMPDATRLELAIRGLGRMSPGTLRTMLEGIPSGGRERIDGEIRVVPMAGRERRVPFPSATASVYSIAWGDVSTAYHTTGIPNIVTYFQLPAWQALPLKMGRSVQTFLGHGRTQSAGRFLISHLVSGPGEYERMTGRCEIWGEVVNARGEVVTGTLSTPEAYALTADAAIRAVGRVFSGDLEPGAYTPARAFGADFISECDGVEVHAFQSGQAAPK